MDGRTKIRLMREADRRLQKEGYLKATVEHRLPPEISQLKAAAKKRGSRVVENKNHGIPVILEVPREKNVRPRITFFSWSW